jgi:hypothetical protein
LTAAVSRWLIDDRGEAGDNKGSASGAVAMVPIGRSVVGSFKKRRPARKFTTVLYEA